MKRPHQEILKVNSEWGKFEHPSIYPSTYLSLLKNTIIWNVIIAKIFSWQILKHMLCPQMQSKCPCESSGQAWEVRYHDLWWPQLQANGQHRGFWTLLSYCSPRTFYKVFKPNLFLAKGECLLWKTLTLSLGKRERKKKKRRKLCTSHVQQAVTQEISSTHSLQREELPAP